MTRPIVAAITVDSVRANGSDEGLRGQSYDAGEYGEGPQAPSAQAATTHPSAVGARVNPNIRHNPVTQRHRAMVDRGLVLLRVYWLHARLVLVIEKGLTGLLRKGLTTLHFT